MEDLLSQILRSTALRGTVYFRADFGAPWAMEIPAKEVAAFHIVISGECWVQSGDDSPRLMGQGDMALFPHGARHSLRCEPDVAPVPAEELLAAAEKTPTGVAFGGGGTPTNLICGHFERDRGVGAYTEHALFSTLPERMVLPAGASKNSAWISTATQLAVLESASDLPGSSAVVDRLAEVLLIQILRAWSEIEEHSSTFLAALMDESLARAINLIHADPSRSRSVEELARAAGMSRSRFAATFRERTGATPISYMTTWRMQLARQMLRDEHATMADIAERIGYDNEFAFSKAFKRVWGETPGSVRRAALRKTG